MRLGKKRYAMFWQTKDREKLISGLSLGSLIARGGDASFALGESQKSFDSPWLMGALCSLMQLVFLLLMAVVMEPLSVH